MPIENSHWLVFSEIERHEAFATTRNAVILLGSGMIAAGFIVNLMLALLIQTQVIRPVRRLRDGAIRLGEGELDYRIPDATTNEIGVVATSFNEMAARLQERESALAQARDQAIAANRFKSRLLANIAKAAAEVQATIVSELHNASLRAKIILLSMLTAGLFAVAAAAGAAAAQAALAAANVSDLKREVSGLETIEGAGGIMVHRRSPVVFGDTHLHVEKGEDAEDVIDDWAKQLKSDVRRFVP